MTTSFVLDTFSFGNVFKSHVFPFLTTNVTLLQCNGGAVVLVSFNLLRTVILILQHALHIQRVHIFESKMLAEQIVLTTIYLKLLMKRFATFEALLVA